MSEPTTPNAVDTLIDLLNNTIERAEAAQPGSAMSDAADLIPGRTETQTIDVRETAAYREWTQALANAQAEAVLVNRIMHDVVLPLTGKLVALLPF